jgi:FkbM family methyltransferase
MDAMILPIDLPGCVVQVGALVGQDPTMDMLRANPGRKAVLVEPVPWFFEMLKTNYKDMADQVAFENAAISDIEGEREMLAMPYVPGMEHNGSGCSSFYPQVILPHNLPVKAVPIKVNCISFETLFRKHGIDKVVFLVLDTEGHDFVLLKAYPWHLGKPSFVKFEYIHLDGYFSWGQTWPKAEKLFAELGYSLAVQDRENALAVLR